MSIRDKLIKGKIPKSTKITSTLPFVFESKQKRFALVKAQNIKWKKTSKKDKGYTVI